MFALGQITFAAIVGVAVSALALLVYQRLAKRDGQRGSRWVWPLAVVVGLSILAWRASGNTPTLNEDPTRQRLRGLRREQRRPGLAASPSTADGRVARRQRRHYLGRGPAGRHLRVQPRLG